MKQAGLDEKKYAELLTKEDLSLTDGKMGKVTGESGMMPDISYFRPFQNIK